MRLCTALESHWLSAVDSDKASQLGADKSSAKFVASDLELPCCQSDLPHFTLTELVGLGEGNRIDPTVK